MCRFKYDVIVCRVVILSLDVALLFYPEGHDASVT